MSWFHIIITVTCVVGIATGQMLFKKAALAINEASGLSAWIFNGWLLAALALYGLTTLLWVWILKHVPLHMAYPFMALAFLIVPVLGYLVLGEDISLKVFIGSLFIIVGVVISSVL